MGFIKRLIPVILLLVSGCASNVPIEVAEPVEGSPQLLEVLQNPEAHKGELIRWGGSIASIENKQNETWVEIVSRKLNRSGRPESSDKTDGRFLAKVNEFLDPEVYNKGRLMTFYGELAASHDGKIGEQPYSFPVVNSKMIYLWPKYHAPPRYPLHYRYYHRSYYDPFWAPDWGLRGRHRYLQGAPRFWY